LVLNISRKGPQSGFRVQGSIINEVQKAIRESEMPRFLYIMEQAAARATKGKPMANQVVGIQRTGCGFRLEESVISGSWKGVPKLIKKINNYRIKLKKIK
jgi:hypothetical protein